MSNQETLSKAIQKAIDGGWKPLIDGDVLGTSDNKFTNELHIVYKTSYAKWTLGESVASIIFNHDFAKALWGDKQQLDDDDGNCLHCGYESRLANPSGNCSHVHYPEDCPVCLAKEQDWKYHLSHMVIADDPIKYLGENI